MWLFWAVFLKYNSHTRKLCRDQYTIQWLLINLQSWETITTIQFKNVSITPKDSSYPFTIAPCSHSQLQATDNLLSVFHIPWNSWNLMTMWSFVFDFFDFSITFLRFTHTVVCISVLCSYCQCIPLCGYTTFHVSIQSSDIWNFPFLDIMNSAAMNTGETVFV